MLRKIVASCVMALAISSAQSQAILTMPAAAGGQSHRVAIALQSKLTEWIGQPVIFDFRPGGGGVVGARHVMQSTAPIHLFLMLAQTHPGFEIDQINDIVPVVELGQQSLLMYASTNLGIRNWKELSDGPSRKLSYGLVNSSGYDVYLNGLFSTVKQHEFVMVPYKAGAAQVADIVGGHINLAISPIGQAVPFALDSKLMPLFVTSRTRSPLLPNIPTQKELGLRFVNDNYVPTMFLFSSKSSSVEINDRIRKGYADWANTVEGQKTMVGLDTEPPLSNSNPQQSLKRLLGR